MSASPRTLGWLLVCAMLGGTACERGGLAGLAVEYAGCRDAFAGPECLIAPGDELTLWLPLAANARVEVLGGEWRDGAEEIAGGWRRSVIPAPAQSALVIVSEHAGSQRSWRLSLRAHQQSPALAEATALAASGRYAEAQSLLRARADELPAASLNAQLARLALRLGHPAEAEAALHAALAAHAQRGWSSTAIDDATMLVYLLLEQRRFGAAREVLESLPFDATLPAESLTLIEYYRGLLATRTGNARGALRALESAAARATRLALPRLQHAARIVLAEQLQALGRRAEAEAIYQQLVADAPAALDDCARGQLYSNLGWNRLLGLEAGEEVADPTPVVSEALRLFERGCPALVTRQVNARLNMALADLHAGRVADARRNLDAAGGLMPPPPGGLLGLWWREIEARLDLRADDAATALRRYRELEQTATAAADPAARWRAVAGQAAALDALGRSADSIDAYGRAEALLDDESLQVPVQEGRESFVATREQTTRRHIELLVDTDRTEEAFAAARRARVRVLLGLQRADRLEHLRADERAAWDAALGRYAIQREELATLAAESWQLPADALARAEARRSELQQALGRSLDEAVAVIERAGSRRPGLPTAAPGELVLAYHPLPRGWAAFASLDGSTRVRRLACVDRAITPDTQSQCLLGPFREELGRASSIRVLPMGLLREVDFHALPYRSDVLLTLAPVVYGLDLPALEPVLDAPGRALIVADPRGDLPAARREAVTVARALAAQTGWHAETLTGPQADDPALRSRLAAATLLHYAGHAVFGGDGGWDSVLPLAGDAVFTVADILSLPAAPRWVVLSGCETGRASSALTAESMGLAQAFIAAGASTVLAAARPVADATAARLVDGFYAAWAPERRTRDALRTAQLELRRAQPAADWASFRVIER